MEGVEKAHTDVTSAASYQINILFLGETWSSGLSHMQALESMGRISSTTNIQFSHLNWFTFEYRRMMLFEPSILLSISVETVVNSAKQKVLLNVTHIVMVIIILTAVMIQGRIRHSDCCGLHKYSLSVCRLIGLQEPRSRKVNLRPSVWFDAYWSSGSWGIRPPWWIS